ncbi:uncharacterized protein [Primulina huaijiensis]|uniref:uncharacterized protein isoform X3 n=1 Tax=Primulina huaijiensis TaxID=1492673 RepID=UPI003CC775F5
MQLSLSVWYTMLQWMGGSRRKVATSRNSTHKRQRQYFEQRKRQQQAAGSEGYVDGKPSCSQNCENNRSLDILSLVNASSRAYENETSSLNARDNSNDDDGFEFHHQYAHQFPSTHTGRDTVNQSEPKEERTSTSHYSDTGKSKKVLVRLTDPKEHLVGNDNKFDHSILSPAQQMSVMDLLGDGGTNSNAEETSVHEQEAHVAFSVEGLGKVEAQTPVQSPKTPGRFFLKGYSSPKKSWKQPTASKHMDYSFDDLGFQMDVMMQDSEFSPFASSRKYPFCSTEKVNIIGDPNPKFLNFRKSSPFYRNGSDLKGVFSKNELFSIGRENGRIIWNGPYFLDGNDDELGDYESFCNSRADPSDVSFNDHFDVDNHWKRDFKFEDWNLQTRRFSTKQNRSFDMADTLLPYSKYKIPEDYPDFKISDTRYTTFKIDDEDKDTSTCFASEDTREISRLSEESCSSTAVRGDATKKS